MSHNLIIIPKRIFLFLAVLLVVYSVLFALNTIGMNVDILGIVLYLTLLVFIFRNNKGILIKYMYFFVMFTWHLGSVVFVDNFATYLFTPSPSAFKLSQHEGLFQ